MKRIQLIFLFTLGFTAVSFAMGPLDNNKPVETANQIDLRIGDCEQATEQIDLAINNVRARILGGGGDLWRESPGNGDANYIIPKVETGAVGVSSIFAGGVWLGGNSEGGNLLVSAVLYRDGSNNDYYPGPLDADGETEKEECTKWDKFFLAHGQEIKLHYKAWQLCEEDPACDYSVDELSDEILGWPAFGNEYFEDIHNFQLPEDSETMGVGLAPFHDEDENGLYDPLYGDYPIIQVRGCEEKYYADEMIFYIYNDNGNTHTQTNSDPIKMEIQVEAFAWKTNDELNDMTFYRYKMINKASEVLDSTFFGMFADIDLGCSEDDFVGVDVERSLAYAYNQDNQDGVTGCLCPVGTSVTPSYCNDIPMIGLDYFRGPLGPFVYDSIAMEFRKARIGEVADTIMELGMTSFVYFTREGAGTTDPANGPEFYNYLTGSWKDGTRITFGGTGYNPGSTDYINYVFPDDPNDPNGWSWVTADVPAQDARTLQSSGPFVLSPGDKNELIIGVPWVPNVPHPVPALDAIRAADDIAQALFDNCFEIVDGPDAPDVCFVEMDQKLIGIMSNGIFSNNFEEGYAARNLTTPSNVGDSLHVFEGYIVYQKRISTISNSDLDNMDEARPVFQCDIKNGHANLYNWVATSDPNSNALLWFPESQVEANDNGIVHSFEITQDKFGGDLVNHKNYFYAAFAYAFNQYEPFNPATKAGQKIEYLAGRNFTEYTATPHKVVDRTLNTDYGNGPIITRHDGVGVGDNMVLINPSLDASILDGSFDGVIEYQNGAGPVNVKIINPLDIKDGDYTLKMVGGASAGGQNTVANNTTWELSYGSEVVASEASIEKINEQIIAERGFSISLGQTGEAGEVNSPNDGAIGGQINFDNPNNPWMYILGPQDAGPILDYLREGVQNNGLAQVEGFSPYTYCRCETGAVQPYVSPAPINAICDLTAGSNTIDELNNVDIIMTSDKTMWSRCVVVETASDYYNQGGSDIEGSAINFDLRQSNSVGKEAMAGNPNVPMEDGDGVGMGWFPGYAIDVETGMRLNVFFGENSAFFPEMANLAVANPQGRDMMFNPGGEVLSDDVNGFQNAEALYLGGQHFVYVTDTEYDECAYLRERFSQTLNKKKKGLEQIKWTGLPMLNPEFTMNTYANGLIPNDVRISLRASNPYNNAIGADVRAGEVNEGLPYYTFKFEGVESELLNSETAETVLDLINVVPNPYNAYSAYEATEIDGRVKITNLPNKCTVSIYSLDGNFIREFKRDLGGSVHADALRTQASVVSEIEWDLKNAKGIPVASGMYLIHISAPGLGERTLKWFGAMRQFDPSKL